MNNQASNERDFLPTLNFHVIEQCNMACRFCFAKYRIRRADHLSVEGAREVITQAAELGIEKVNFAGGEPLLYPHLGDLLTHTSALGLTTSLVTNGSLLTRHWLERHARVLDLVGISVDSVDALANVRSGRALLGRDPIAESSYREMAIWIREANIKLKLNTVVSRFNVGSDMNQLLLDLQPDRWKIFQALVLDGVNSRKAASYAIDSDAFNAFVGRHQPATKLIPTYVESDYLMTSSYLMVDPKGRLHDNSTGRLTYSDPITKVGLKAALTQVQWSVEKFRERTRSIPNIIGAG